MTMFEKAKKRLRPDGVSNVRLAIPMSFGVVYTQETTYNMADILPSVCGNHGVEFRQSHIIFSNDAALKLFEGAIAGITRVVDSVIAQPQLANCRFVLLVGGFSESGEDFAPQSWLRLPKGAGTQAVAGPDGATVWIKRDHLGVAPKAPG